ncbi:MAG: nucleoside deaminase [Leptospiraceae bacterium]|nr:nucleoside deaminase [Leptospiraceae bacterium]MDW8306977.1 nucleoside deaminase [Leptospiraceae bacterium]
MYTIEELRFFMQMAYEEALAAFHADEVPVGAVVVKEGELIARASNLTVKTKDPTAHAELLAIRKAAQVLGNERLVGCELLSTLEPCTMCTGALLFARIRKVYFLADELRQPALRQVVQLQGHNHTIEWEKLSLPGLDSSALLRRYFASKR